MRRDLELRRFARDILTNFGRVAGATLLGIVTSIIVARTLGAEGRGAYALAIMLPNTLITFTSLGTIHAMVYYVAREHETSDVSPIINTGIAISIWASLIGIGIGLLIIQLGGNTTFPNVSLTLMVFALVLLPLINLRQNLRGVFRGYEDFRSDGGVEILYGLVNVALLVVLVWWIQGQVWGALLANIGASLVALAFTVYRLNRRTSFTLSWSLLFPRPGIARQLLAYGLRVYVAQISFNLLLRADQFLLNLLGAGVASVGIYAVGVALAERLRILMSAVISVIMPRISSWDGDEERRNIFTPLVVRHTLWLSILAAAGIAFLGRPLVRLLYGTEFEDAATTILILLPGLILLNMGEIISSDTAGRGKPGIGAVQSLLALGINLVANLVLIPRYDLLGAALASTIAYGFLGITWVIVFCRLNRQPWQSLVFPTGEDFQRMKRVMDKLRRMIVHRTRQGLAKRHNDP